MAASGGSGGPRDISLAALRRQDPYIQSIVDVASQVALYTFSPRVNEWEKTEVEGTLFVHSRSASPKHGFTIMNRLSMENRTEPITKDLDFQVQDPFLLYKNARFCIHGIWFYDKEECQRIAELIKNLTHQEQLKAQQAANIGLFPMPNHLAGQEVDILKMLNKAKDEYTKCKPSSEPKAMTSSSAIHSNPNLIKPIAVKPSDASQHVSSLQQNKSENPKPQPLSLTDLFGKAEKNLIEGQDPFKVRPTVVRSLSYEGPGRQYESGVKELCPAIKKLMVRGADLLPVSEIPENQIGSTHPPGDVSKSLFRPIEELFTAQESNSHKRRPHKLPKTRPTVLHPEPGVTSSNHYFSGPITSTTINTPTQIRASAPHQFYDDSQQSQNTFSHIPLMPPTSQQPSAPGTISPNDLLKKLNLVRQDQQYRANSKPALAAKFPVVSPPAVTNAWVENLSQVEKSIPLLEVLCPQQIPATFSLLPPLVFTSTQKAMDMTKPALPDNDVTAKLPLPLFPANSVSNQSTVLTKTQLRDTLLHLIQNDESFLNTIYEAYFTILNKRGAPTGMH
ncbi:mRNA-decapping enzyme 1B [Pyxicephalus adspersus]|uniref:5'-(N(7)-methylguanosine 5'-triphospho)-[mRNA] hydrolase n=1 Tax=Pyxicephalus adspersus TaxID=30357 RepID=A0AAV3AX82_PYXAD|nr:TPA: hypothetical protein GDO54_006308 [Pyxicephalus adspersus]